MGKSIIWADEKFYIEQGLQDPFNNVFLQAPSAGQFNFRTDANWPTYYNSLQQESSLRGVWICRTIGSGAWFPIYHYNDTDADKDTLKNDAGINYYAYIPVEK